MNKMRDLPLEEILLNLLSARAADKTICPSEALVPEEKQNPSRMAEVRAAAERLRQRGLVEITQRGQVVGSAEARGPIRIRWRNR